MSIHVALVAEILDRHCLKPVVGQLDAANAMLMDAGYASHEEPAEGSLDRSDERCALRTIDPVWLECLQRFRAHMIHDPDCTPKPMPPVCDAEPHDDGVLDQVLERPGGCRSHLLCHAPEGIFVPVAFDEPIYDVHNSVPGGWLGSSQMLLEEMVAMSPLLGINLRPLRGRGSLRLGGGFDISDQTAAAINQLAEEANGIATGAGSPRDAPDADAAGSGHAAGYRFQELSAREPFWRERIVWLLLYETARRSVQHGTAIVLMPK